MVLTGPGEKGEANARKVDGRQRRKDRPQRAPKPGEGPSKEERENGRYDLLYVAVGTRRPPGPRRGQGRSRSRLRIDLEDDLGMRDLPAARYAGRSGRIWTPGAAMGDKLIKRLVDHAGSDVRVEN